MTRINYTGRKRITRDRVRLRISTNGSVRLFADNLNLDGLGLPADAEVVIEARQLRTRFMRLECGSVAAMRLPTGDNLAEFDATDGLRFRVKVVGVSGADEGKILAAADGIVAAAEGDIAGREPLLPFRGVELEQRLWQLELPDGDWPAVLVNKAVGDWHQFARKPSFQALVLPEVARQVAVWLIDHLEEATEGDTDSAPYKWRRFFALFGRDPAETAPDDAEERRGWALDWADDVAARFARRHKFRDLLTVTIEDVD